MRTYLKLAALACVAFLLAGCAGMTAAETTAVVATGGGALVGLIEALSPYLPPAKVAELTTHVNNAEGIIGAIARGVGAVAEAAQNAQAAADAANAQASEAWTGTDVTAAAGGAGGLALLTSRAMSAIKDAKTGRREPAKKEGV